MKKETVKILGQTVTVGTKKHAELAAQVKHFNDLEKSEAHHAVDAAQHAGHNAVNAANPADNATAMRMKLMVVSMDSSGFISEYVFFGTEDEARANGGKYGCRFVSLREASAEEWQREMWKAEDADIKVREEEGDL